MDLPPSAVNEHDNYPAGVALLSAVFAQADALNAQINSQKSRDPALWLAIVSQLRTDWTYHSNGIEGSTLSRGETHFFLSEGLTVEGKPFKDFVDAQNHAEAIDLLFEVVANTRPITESLIKEINALLLRGVSFTPARNAAGGITRKTATPGHYKTLPNHVAQADGTIHSYVEPIYVIDQMQQLIARIQQPQINIHPIQVAAVAHYNMVRIHPFDDGNGRGARILMNLLLLHKGFFPAVIRLETKRQYLDTLSSADKGNLLPFIEFIAKSLISTQESVLAVLQRAAPKSS